MNMVLKIVSGLLFCLILPLGASAQTDGTVSYDLATSRLRVYLGVLGWNSIGVSNLVGSCGPLDVGRFEYDSGLSIYKFCNGSDWISFSLGVTTSSCTEAGQLSYSGDYNLLFCNGANWVRTVNLTHGYFVMTSNSMNGNLGGLSGADATCLTNLNAQPWLGKSDAQSRGLLTASKVKAFLCDNTTCNNANASTTYRFARAGSATVGGASFTTNASGLGPNNSGRWSGATYFNNTLLYWTNRDQLPSDNVTWAGTSAGASNTCLNWTTGSSATSGNFGSADFTNANRWYTTGQTCNVNLRLVCFVHP